MERVRRAWAQSKEWVRHLEGVSPPSERDRAIAEVVSRSSVASGRKSDLIQIDCKGPSPEWSQKIVATMMDVYQLEHMRLNRPSRSVEFFTEQTERARKDLTAKQEALRALKDGQRHCFLGRSASRPCRSAEPIGTDLPSLILCNFVSSNELLVFLRHICSH